MTQVKEGDRVKVHYTGRLPNGDVFDSSDGKDPLVFEVGGSDVIPGVSSGVLGMTVGQERRVEVSPEEGYGPHVSEMVTTVARSMVPEGVKVGDHLQASGEGHEFVVWVRELSDDEVVLDANHPLAGTELTFDVTLVEILSD